MATDRLGCDGVLIILIFNCLFTNQYYSLIHKPGSVSIVGIDPFTMFYNSANSKEILNGRTSS